MDYVIVPTYYDYHYQISKSEEEKKRKRKRECLRRFEQLQAKQACREALNNFDLFPFVSLVSISPDR